MANANSELQKNDIIEVDIESEGYRGEGIARINRVPVFISGALKGEHVRALIILVKKDYAVGKLIEVKRAAKERVQAKCEYFGKCGGCNIMHMTYDAQREFKRELVRDNLRKIAHIEAEVEECEASPEVWGYRNKLSLPVREVGGESKVGMFAFNSHRIIEITDCLLQTEKVRKMIPKLRELANKFAAYNEESGKGELRHFVVRDVNERLTLTVVTTKDITKKVLSEVKSIGLEADEIWININKEKNNVILGGESRKIWSRVDKTENNVEGKNAGKSEIHPRSFLQVNSGIAEKLYNAVKEEVKAADRGVVIDAYSGSGNMTAMLSEVSEEVIGIEIEPSATAAADELMKRRGITNVKNITGDCAKVLPDLINVSGKGIIILDPPRTGCSEEVTAAVNESGASEVIYISCNPSTLARDLARLENYSIKRIKPYDMFPETCHVETLVFLCRK